MGWTGTTYYNRNESNKEILKQEFHGWLYAENSGHEVLDVSQRGANVWFLCRDKQTGQTWAFITLCKRYRNEFCYKEMELSEHPFYYDMPKKWLPLLSAEYMNKEFCREWLSAFYEAQAKKSAEKAAFPSWAKVTDGARFSCTFAVDIANDSFKAGDTVTATWSVVYGGLVCGRYLVTKRRIRKFFSQVKEAA